MSERLRGQLMLALYRSGRRAEALAAYRAARGDARRGSRDRTGGRASTSRAGNPRSGPCARRADDRRPRTGNARVAVAFQLVHRPQAGAAVDSHAAASRRRSPADADRRRWNGEDAPCHRGDEGLDDDFPDGVVLVELAPINNPDLVPAAIAEALGLGERPGRKPVEVVVAYLRSSALLVLDNFEHVNRSPQLAELLAGAPGATLLVTSRTPLDISERIYRVPALRLPDRSETGQLGRVTRTEAVRLFVDRARDVRADFELTDANADAVVELCLRLDGLPLAIELAAARIKLLSPSAIVAPRPRLELLRAEPGSGAPARHRTLRDAIEWSYDLLGAEEQGSSRAWACSSVDSRLTAPRRSPTSRARYCRLRRVAPQQQPAPDGAHRRRRASLRDAGDDPRVRARASP